MKPVIQIKRKSKDVFELPDGSIAYTMEKALQEYKKIELMKYSVSDLILFLLYSQEKPLRGKTVFFKEIFYFEKEIFKKENLENCKFIPYYYGPYSFYVSNKLEYLIGSKFIKKTKQHDTGKDELVLTPLGKKTIQRKYNTLSPGVRDNIEKLRKGLDQYGIKILNIIYKDEKYKKYIVKSKISHRYKLITWGKKTI